jgi:hypothetical protein
MNHSPRRLKKLLSWIFFAKLLHQSEEKVTEKIGAEVNQSRLLDHTKSNTINNKQICQR